LFYFQCASAICCSHRGHNPTGSPLCYELSSRLPWLRAQCLNAFPKIIKFFIKTCTPQVLGRFLGEVKTGQASLLFSI